MRALRDRKGVDARLIHTGQHYDVAMNAAYFNEFAIPEADVNLEVGAGADTEQTARIMIGLEPQLVANRPDMLWWSAM